MKKIFSVLAVMVMGLVLIACGKKPYKPDLSQQVDLNMSVYFGSGTTKYTITYQHDNPYVSKLNGKTYTKGSLLPVWETIGEKANIKFNDVVDLGDESTNAQWTRLLSAGFGTVDLVNTTGANIAEEGSKGQFLDFGKYLDKMPNLSKFFKDNPSVKLSLTSGDGGIYSTPYFDGINELEHMYLARIDWIKELLDPANTNDFSTEEYVVPTNYKPVTPKTENYTVKVANATGGTRNVTKVRSNNVIDVLRAVQNPTGKSLADAFRNYLTNTYTSLEKSGYAKWSDVFAGSDASYDTDELIALMYVIKANQSYLLKNVEGVTNIQLYFAREKAGNRMRQYFRGLEMFGLRGVSSRNEWLFVDEKGEVHDARALESTVDTIDNGLANLFKDGLLPDARAYGGTGAYNFRQNFLTGDGKEFGFLTYDYNASSTPSSLVDATKGGKKRDSNFEFQAILPPVVKWNDGDDKTGYFHFSESNRSVKNEAWGAPIHVANDQTKLERVLYLVDQLYNYESKDSIGNIHLYGPVEWSEDTQIDYGTEKVNKLNAKAMTEMKELGGGDMIKYLRGFLGATMPIGHVRSLGLEFQTLSDQGIAGINRINTAIKAGTFKLAGLVDTKNTWYNLIPTNLPYTEIQRTAIQSTTFRNILTDNNFIEYALQGFSGTNQSKASYMAIIQGENEYPLFISQVRSAYRAAQGN